MVRRTGLSPVLIPTPLCPEQPLQRVGLVRKPRLIRRDDLTSSRMDKRDAHRVVTRIQPECAARDRRQLPVHVIASPNHVAKID